MAACTICAALFAVSPGAHAAQSYPTKPIRLVISLAPGGGTDTLARKIAQELGKSIGENVIPDNRPAVDGIIATELVARAHPDGYTLLFVSSGHVMNAAIGRKLPYDSINDFAPITQPASQQIILVVHPSLPVKSVKELIDYAKQKPGELNYGASSSGVQLPMELVNSMAGIKTNYIPYKGSAPTLVDLIAGRIQLAFGPAMAFISHVKTGKLRALAIGDSQRSAAFPDIPTIAETGLPGFLAVSWLGMMAPAKVPRPIVERLNKEVVDIVRTPDFREWCRQNGSDPVGSTPEAFTAFLKAEIAKWSAIVKKINLRPPE
jgi:tripartite-type tricarboxylate transporter receptor subunit TctC